MISETYEQSPNIDTWFNHLIANYAPAEQRQLKQALDIYQHCIPTMPQTSAIFTIVEMLVRLRLDAEGLIAAILHLLVENDKLTVEAVKTTFGEETAQLLENAMRMQLLKDLYHLQFQENISPDEKNTHLESIRVMILAMISDVRVVLIKLVERLYEMQQLDAQPKHLQRRIARETLELYAPLANRLGIWQIKWQLEDLALRYSEPEVYRRIARHLDRRRGEREQIIEQMIHELRETLHNNGIKAEISGRPKHIYSIWQKMKKKSKQFSELNDILAIRVLVNTIGECYSVLGIVHGCYPPMENEFDDYIARPKQNYYRSLHTAVIGPNNHPFEVQIRTHEMHFESEIGIASHWRYKEGKFDSANDEVNKKIFCLRRWQDESKENNSADLITQFKEEVYGERIYVLTPKGQVIDLPAGSTPLDFAYHIHTSIGHRCRAASVNGKVVQLNHVLNSGDQIFIHTAQQERPSRHWLNDALGFLKTDRAKSKINQWFRLQDRSKNIAEGRSLLNRELFRLNVTEFNLEELVAKYHYNDVDSLLEAIGLGTLDTSSIADALQDRVFPPHCVTIQTKKKHSPPILIQGHFNKMQTYLAECCNPVPEETVVGYITDKGIQVHRRDCPLVQDASYDEDGWVNVEWGAPTGVMYPVEIHIKADDRFGLLRDVSTILAEAKINITAVSTLTDDDFIANMNLRIETRDVRQLSKALAEIDSLNNVLEVNRMSPSLADFVLNNLNKT
jgi:GTP pyrophosphokinase